MAAVLWRTWEDTKISYRCFMSHFSTSILKRLKPWWLLILQLEPNWDIMGSSNKTSPGNREQLESGKFYFITSVFISNLTCRKVMVDKMRRGHPRCCDCDSNHGVVETQDGLQDDLEVILRRRRTEVSREQAKVEALGAGGQGEHQGAALGATKLNVCEYFSFHK